MRTLLVTLVAAASLAAQSSPSARQPRAPLTGPDHKPASAPVAKTSTPAPAPQRVPTPVAGRRDPAASPPQPLPAHDFLVFDTSTDGAIWVAASGWKAKVASDGVRFAPFLGAEAAGDAHVDLALLQITQGDAPLAFSGATPTRQEQAITLDRGAVLERYDARPEGIEQSFVFASLPTREALTVRIALRTPLAVTGDGTAVVCQSAAGGVRITDAVAVDARGARQPLPMTLEHGVLRLTVPADFVARATLPLVVDPTVSPIVNVAGPVKLERPDIAYDPTLAEYFAVWQRDFTATDRDVFAWRLDAGTVSIGPMLAVDVTFDSWEYPRVANCDLADGYLAVAQVSYPGAGSWIGARSWTAVGGMGPQFVVEGAWLPGHRAGDKLFPDVGGDPSPVGPVYYTVVWERVWSATDHDVHMKQVTPTGTLRSAAPTLLDNSIDNTTHPRIGKSDGRDAGSNSQFWPVVWQRTFSPTDEDVYGTTVSWDGQPRAAGPFAVSIHSDDERDPVVSSPTDEVAGSRHMLFAWARHDAVNDWDILAAYHDDTGFQRGVLDLNVADSLPAFAALPQWNAAVDCDGLRFAVGYTEDFVGTTARDTHVSLLAWDELQSVLVVDEPRVWFGQTFGQEDHMAIVAQGSAGGASIYYGVVHDLDDGNGTYGICSYPYTGYADQPLPTTRLNGCGTLGITLQDLPVIGTTITVTQTDSGPLTGFVFGVPQTLLLPFCPGCMLGVDGFLTSNPLVWTVPPVPAYVGIELSVQAFSVLGGPCLGSIALSNTIDFRVL